VASPNSEGNKSKNTANITNEDRTKTQQYRLRDTQVIGAPESRPASEHSYHDQDHAKQYPVATLISQWLTTIFTGLAFAAAAIYACYAHQQVQAMQNTLTQTISLVQSAAIQASAASKAAEAEATAAAAARTVANAAQSQAETNRELANESRRANSRAERALRITERATVEPIDIRCTTYPGPLTLDTQFILTYKNVGNSPATDFQSTMSGGNPRQPTPEQTGESSRVEIGEARTIDTNPLPISPEIAPNQKVLQAIIDGTAPFEIWGKFQYSDPFGSNNGSFRLRYDPHTSCSFTIVEQK
jgi:hypothetical protein